MINLQRLEGFYWVARTGGYARAARAFPYPISQPGVHQAVRRLEEDLGAKLFERAGKDRVVPTPAGAALLELVAPFYEQLPVVEAAIRGGAVGGTLRVHAAGFPLRHLLPAWLRRLHDRRPDVKVALTEVRTADLSALRSGDADLLVDWIPAPPPDVEVRELARVHAFVVAPASGPYAKGTKLARLAGAPFIAYHGDRALRALQLEALASHGITPRETLAADSSDTILGFVAAGLGYSLVPALGGGPRVAGVVAARLERPRAEFSLHAAFRRRAAPHPLVEAALSVAPQVG